MDKPRPVFRCPLCRSASGRPWYAKPHYRFRRCRCGTLFQEHPPTEAQLRHLYQEYHEHEYGGPPDDSSVPEPFFTAAARTITRRKPNPGALLDVGCAYGDFLRMMRDRGWTVAGCEVAAPALRYARETHGVTVHDRDILDLDLPPESFDVITAFYVIEHLLRPRDFIRKTGALLKPGGILLLRFPRTASLLRFADIVNPGHDLLHYPYHIADFPSDAIHRALLSNGFREVFFSFAGSTRGGTPLSTAVSFASSSLAGLLHVGTLGRFLLPGVSVNAIAVK